MLSRLPFYNALRLRHARLGPGTRGFLQSLSVVSLCFAASKVFSSISTIIMARYLGRQLFGEASVVLLVAQVISPVMLLGLHMSVMRYGTNKENPAPWISTAFYTSLGAGCLVTAIVFFAGSSIAHWLSLTSEEIHWALLLGAAMAMYMLFTHFYQTLNLFTARGLLEILMGFGLLPGLAVGFWISGKSSEMALIAYLVAYLLCLPPMLLRFYRMLSPANLFAPDTAEMLKYGSYACFGSIGFILTFVVQPLQIHHYLGEGPVGLYRLYSASSISLATFATTIFYTVFFPKAAASTNRKEIWRRMTKAWARAAAPLLALYAAVFSISVWLSGEEFPLTWQHVILFSAASMLITIQTTYGQLIAAQGVSGMRLGLVVGIVSGIFNILVSMWMIPRFGIYGAVLTLILNFLLSLLFMLSIKDRLYPSLPTA